MAARAGVEPRPSG